MTIIQKLITALKDYVGAFGIGRKTDHGNPMDWEWVNDPFFTEEQRKTEKLAALARYIVDAKALVERRKSQKKKHTDVLAAIFQAQCERLEIETGRRVWSPAFGAWVKKEEA